MMLEDMSYMSFVDYLTAESDLRERQRKERMKQAAFEEYAKEHNLFVCTTNIIEQIRSEIEKYEVECMLKLSMNDQTCNRCTADTFKNIYQIIDKNTGRKESE